MSKQDERSAAVSTHLVESVLDEQRRLWEKGERVLVEAHLQRLPALAKDPGVLLDLVYNEIVLREKAGEKPLLDEYARRFPALKDDLALQFEVDRGLDWQMVADASTPPVTPKLAPPRKHFSGTPFPPLPGYTLDGVLGYGASGVVYKARQLSQDRGVAVKVVLAALRKPADALAQLRAAAALIGNLHHAHICPIHEIGMDAGRLFIAQERVNGNLAKRLLDAPVTPLQAAQWLEILARTLHDIHRLGIVHGKLTTSNILLSYNGILKITDVGVTRIIQPASISLERDVHSLGAILYESLVGHSPQGEWVPPSQRRAEVPAYLEKICVRCLHPQPHDAYDSAGELADDVKAFLEGKPAKTSGGFFDRIKSWTQPSRKQSSTFVAASPETAQQRQRADRLQRTLDLVGRLLRFGKRDELLAHLAETIGWLVNAEKVAIFLLDRQRNEWWARLTRSNGIEELRIPADRGIIAATEPVLLTDPYRDSRFDPAIDEHLGVTTRSFLGIPLVGSDSKILGVAEAINKCEGTFTPDDQAAMCELLGPAAHLLERTGE